jgi:hypothetical protein
MLGNRVIIVQPAAWGSSIFGLEHARSRRAVALCRRYVSDYFKSRAWEALRPRAMQPSQHLESDWFLRQHNAASLAPVRGVVCGYRDWEVGVGMPPHIGSDFPATYPATSTRAQRAYLVIGQR